MKKIFKTAVAVLSAMAMLVSFSACGEKPANTTTAPTETSSTQAPTSAQADTTQTADTTAEEDESSTQEVTSSEPATEIVTTTTATTTKKAVATTTKKGATTTKAAATTAAAAKVPATKKEILAAFNTASAKVVSSKPGFKKSTSTTIPSLEMGALAKISVVRGAVGDFLGEGSSSNSVAKGKANTSYYVKSTLKESDITKATCKLSADKKYYEIQLTVINETNPLKRKSALGRFSNDFKDQQEILAGLKDVGASAESVTMKTTSVVINAKVSVDGSKFNSLSYSIKTDASLKGVKYSIAKVKSATGKMQTSVKYSGFAY